MARDFLKSLGLNDDDDDKPISRALTFTGVWLLFVVGIIAGVFLSGCAARPAPPAPWERPADQAGNVWPTICKRDLSAAVAPGRVAITYIPRETLRMAAGRDVNGLTWSFGVQGDEAIWIADDLEGFAKADTIQHEYCHLAEYGGMAWHA